MADLAWEDEGDDDLEDDVLRDVHPNTLLISRTLTDDAFVGRLSKYVFQRLPSQAHISLTYHQEIACYIKYHLSPTLKEILHGSTDRWYIWVACCTIFYKEGNYEEKAERWSSFRSASLPFCYLDTPFIPIKPLTHLTP